MAVEEWWAKIPIGIGVDEIAFDCGLKFGKSIKAFGRIYIDEIMSVLKERMGKSNYEEWCNIRSKIENKGDVKSMKKNRCINVNSGDLVFWHDRKSGRVVRGKVVEISFCRGKGCIIIDNDNHLDYKSILFVIPRNIYRPEEREFENWICNILQCQFDRKEKVNKHKEPEIKLYPFQAKIYSEIINCNMDSEHRKGRKYLFIEMPPRTGKTTLINMFKERHYETRENIMNLRYGGRELSIDLRKDNKKCPIVFVDDMQKTLVDTTKEINEAVLYTADCIKEYATDNALIVFLNGRFGINDYTSVMRSHIVNQVANGNTFSLSVKKYPAWENSASQCSPMLDYKTLKGIKEQMGEEMFSVMYLLKV
jgi:hypothetical protein